MRSPKPITIWMKQMLSKRQVTTRALCLVLMALLLQGCVGSEMADLIRFVATAH